jgi:quinoprotein relay system zinc metallohydrolase 2
MRAGIALVFLLLLLGVGAAAAETLPTVEVAPGVHVHEGEQSEASEANAGGIANIGFIVGESAVMVVDPGGSAVEGRRLRAAIRAVTDLPIRYVVLTHVHLDHVFGAAAFSADPAEVIGHAKLPGALAQRGSYYLRSLQRALGDAADGTVVVVPTRLVETRTEIDLGNRPVVVRAHGPAHTDTDLSLLDLRSGTLWLSDLLFVERIPVIDGSLVGWLNELEQLKTISAGRVVPGHGPVAVPWPQAAEAQERYLRTVLDETRPLVAAGVDIGAAPLRVGTAERDRWLLFDEYHARNVLTAYKELEWE